MKLSIFIHEAAHIIIAKKRGIPVKRVNVNEVEQSGASLINTFEDIDSSDEEELEKRAYDIAIAAAAGKAADEKNSIEKDFSEDDYIAIQASKNRLRSIINIKERIDLDRKINNEAKKDVEKYWDEIIALSEELKNNNGELLFYK